jgi:hypothetical protein
MADTVDGFHFCIEALRPIPFVVAFELLDASSWLWRITCMPQARLFSYWHFPRTF